MTTLNLGRRPLDLSSKLGAVSNNAKQTDGFTVRSETGEGESSATVYLYGVVGSYWDGLSAGEIVRQIKDLDVKQLDLHIHSPGGSAFDGIAIFNAFRNHPAKVVVTVDGIAASAASVIAMAGDEIIMSPGSQMMIHDAWLLTIGNAAELREDADWLDKQSQNIAGIYAHRAGGKADDWRASMLAETWYTAEEAVAAGLADKVSGSAQETDSQNLIDWNLSMFTYAGREAAPAPAASMRTAPKPPTASADGSITTQEGSPAVAFSDEQVTNMRQKLGVAEDADEATILAALDEALRPAEPTARPQIPEGMTLVEESVLDDLRSAAEDGRAARQQQMREKRDRAINDAIKAGKTTPARREHWQKAWDADPEGVEQMLASLPEGLAVPTASIGHDGDPVGTTQASEDAEYYALYPEEKKAV